MPLFLGDQIVAGNANATDTDKKIFLIGAETQGEDVETFSHDTVYVDEDGFLYIDGEKAAKSSEIPTKISAFTNDADYATTNEVKQEIANLVNSAPDKLNTLDELAAALGDDENFATTVTNKITSAQSKADDAYTLAETKQSKITGTAGQFVIIGEDGNITTKTIPNAEEASF